MTFFPEPGLTQCNAQGCTAQTETPWADNWSWIGFVEEIDGLPEGFYCPPHADAFEAFYWGPDGIGWDLGPAVVADRESRQ